MALKKKAHSAVKIAKGVKVAPGKKSALQKKPGGSNVGKYKNVKKGEFCGPAGGAPTGSFPVNSKKRARAALAYAHNAPNPSGIKKCVRSKFPEFKKRGEKNRNDEIYSLCGNFHCVQFNDSVLGFQKL